MEYNVEICDSISSVQVSQVYENKSDVILETEFVFAITAKSAFNSLKVLFEDRIVVGVIKVVIL